MKTAQLYSIIASVLCFSACGNSQFSTAKSAANKPAVTVPKENSTDQSGVAGGRKSGVSAEQVVLDPGIGFGKTIEHNLQLLAGLRSFTNLERPLLLGVSRKSFLAKIAGTDDRLPAALACSTRLSQPSFVPLLPGVPLSI